ncbi:MAG: trigger factor [Tistrella sp.]|jgi:trigger factor|uniref:Trigger factor n=1 Tax=Tistrella mobilis TaxID=171437 RepID=A0A162M2B8_9PROT|nr:trigger factor [Tistrella mobilis]KYO57855.1 trigger factor [Tistrella mobilis]MBA74280.1 trigger factor [Tistrella sp.]HAE48399.1 trigger factor [Tistrella mobilis]
MQITETNAEGLKREYKVVVPAASIDEKIDARIAQIAATIKMPGFRPGKIPAKVVKQRYGSSVMGEVLEEAVNETSRNVLDQNNLRPATQPKIEITAFDEGQDLEYSMVVEIMPEFELGDFSDVELVREAAEVDEKEVDEALERIAAANREFETVEDRAAENGDQVVIDFKGFVDGEAFQGGEAEGYALALGSGTFIPGFEDQLLGAKAGEERKVEVSFPEDYGAEHLAGKAAVFETTVKEVQAPKTAGIDDALAEKLGLDNLDALKAAIRDDFRGRYDQISRQKLKRALLDALAGRYEFEVPAGMLEAEFEGIWKQLTDEMARTGQTFESMEKTEDEVREEYRAIALRRVRLGLVLAEVGRVNDVQVADEEVNRALIEQARRFPGQEARVIEYYQKNPDALRALRAPIFEDKVVDHILAQAKVEEKVVSAEDLMKDPDEDGEAGEASDKSEA